MIPRCSNEDLRWEQNKKSKGGFDMTQILPWGSLGAVSKEEDLNLRPTCGFSINPPPEHDCCDVCGRHIDGLKLFGGPGDPLEGDFSGRLLLKIYRPMSPYDEEAQRAWDEYSKENPLLVKFDQPIKDRVRYVEYEEREDPADWFIKKFGKEKGESLYVRGMMLDSSRPSWECRDCVVLNDDEYFEKRHQRYKKGGNE